MTFAEICRELSDNPDPEDPRTEELVALVNVYWRAMEEAKDHGYVGVGCITFAEERLKQ